MAMVILMLLLCGDIVGNKKRNEEEYDLENLHWHADVKKLTVVALICIVPEITCIVHEITSKYLKLSENTSWYQLIPHSTNSMRKPNNT